MSGTDANVLRQQRPWPHRQLQSIDGIARLSDSFSDAAVSPHFVLQDAAPALHSAPVCRLLDLGARQMGVRIPRANQNKAFSEGWTAHEQ